MVTLVGTGVEDANDTSTTETVHSVRAKVEGGKTQRAGDTQDECMKRKFENSKLVFEPRMVGVWRRDRKTLLTTD